MKLNNRIGLSLLCATSGVTLTGVVTGCSQARASQPKRLNIVYIMCDDHSFQTISAYGHPLSKLAPTPNIDRLARMGIRFDRAYVENSLSTPSRACLMTGLYSHQNGQTMLTNVMDSTVTFIPELMQQAGYQTAMIGKWHMLCEPRGFDTYSMLAGQGEYYNPRFKTPQTAGRYVREAGYATELITQHAIDFLQHSDREKPFLLYVHHKAPHRPWLPPMKYLDLYEDVEFPLPETFYDDYATRGSATREQRMRIDEHMSMIYDLKLYGYEGSSHECDVSQLWKSSLGNMTPEQREQWQAAYARKNQAFMEAKEGMTHDEIVRWKYQRYIKDYVRVIKSVDDSVGELLDYLEANGLMENTMIVYTSDQGFYMGEHGWFDKRFMYEESFRTPLIIYYPGNRGGTTSDALVQNLDFGPTFLDIAGQQQPSDMYGLSLLPVLRRDGTEPGKWRKTLYYHFYDHTAEHNVMRHDGLFDKRYKLIHFYDETGAQPGYDEFFDLREDPNELNNLAGNPKYRKKIRKYQEQLEATRKAIGVKEF
ncbi:MAG: sulfatase [Bacteroidaceae bacterium]|nr:sulfatase [Bacteroidaceae bacterium]